MFYPPHPPSSLGYFLLSPGGEVELGHTFPPGIPALMGKQSRIQRHENVQHKCSHLSSL